jgi:hypothetical protein
MEETIKETMEENFPQVLDMNLEGVRAHWEVRSATNETDKKPWHVFT